MPVYLVRHAKAGDREDWKGDDRQRPLTKSGHRQAEALVDQLKNDRVDAVMSSPYLRCVQTVEPLASARGLSVEPKAELEEGKGTGPLMGLIAQASGRSVVFCTHGDIVDNLLDELTQSGVIRRSEAANQKGGTWVLVAKGDRISSASYRQAPEG